MTLYLTELDSNEIWFPPNSEALSEPNGLIAYGGDLSTERLLFAYQNGIFPWYGPGEPILWWTPTPRAVFDPKTFKPSKSLRKFQKKTQYRVSINLSTDEVIDYCASTRCDEETWLNEDMRSAYKSLAKKGLCHSVEVWDNNALIGGLYGISVGRIFCGESMFSLKTNASKIALWYFCKHFSTHMGQVIDCQVMNDHLLSLGAIELEREIFMQKLLLFKEKNLPESCFEQQWLTP